MKHSFTIPRRHRFVAHFFLVLEQMFGWKRMKARHMSWMESKWGGRSKPQEVPVDRVGELSPKQFQRAYFNTGRPVIFEGAAKSWPCTAKWNLDFFSGAHGGSDVFLMDSQGLTTRDPSSKHEFLTIKELVGDIRQNGDRYLRFSPLLHENPELAEDLNLSWLEKMRGGGTFGNTYYMFLGGAGKTTYLHADQPCNLYVQIHGEKKWTMFYPEDSSCLYPQVTNTAYVKSPVDINHPDFEKYPLFAAAKPMVAHLKPGDVMYVPPHVWHQVENLTDSIAVGFRFSSLKAALRSSLAFSLIRILSTNPPVWKTRKYGAVDTNLIWAHSAGKIEQVMREREERRERRHELHP